MSTQIQTMTPEIVNTNVQTLDNIRRSGTQRTQLKKVSQEFEAIFVTKMISALDKTVDKEGGIFGSDDKYMQKFKSYIYDEVGRQIAHNPYSTVGFAKQIYTQMEKALPAEPQETGDSAKKAVQEQGVREYKKVDREI